MSRTKEVKHTDAFPRNVTERLDFIGLNKKCCRKETASGRE